MEIAQFSIRGEFKATLHLAAELKACETISSRERIEGLIAQYKVERDNYDYKKDEISLHEAQSIMGKNGKPIDFEFKLLLAENYAHLRKPEAYFKLVPSIEE